MESEKTNYKKKICGHIVLRLWKNKAVKRAGR